MKKYNRPNVEIVEFDVEEIITLSVGADNSEIDKESGTHWSIDTETYYAGTTDSYKM